VFETTSEITKLATLVLAVLLPAIGAFFLYRREMSKTAQPPNVGQAGLIAIAGGLTSERGMRDYIQSQEDMSKAILSLASVNEHGAKTNSRELDRVAEALEEILREMRRRGA
jgi:hypothetical protein